VLPTERIAHLGTVDCCIHPAGRYETIAVTPPIIFSKEVAQNRPPPCAPATSLTPKIVLAKFPGMRPGSKFEIEKSPLPGALIKVGDKTK
jgi:hypothetical protein